MRVIALESRLRQSSVASLEHLGLWAPWAMQRSPPLGPEAWPVTPACRFTYHRFPTSPERRARLTWRARGLHDLP